MGVKRVDQDELAAASHRNMVAAYDRGFFDDLVTPFLGVYRDNNLRADSSAEKLAKLKPVFGIRQGDATMTAGNSTPLTDGASVALLAGEQWAQQHGIEPLAYYVDGETAAVDYVNGRDGLLMAPTYAVPRLLARNGLMLQDFDFYEIHEAFASVVLAHLQAWESEEYCKERLGLDSALGPIDRSKLNVNGSSIAAGIRSPRPVAASWRSWPSSSPRSASRPVSRSAGSSPSARRVGGVWPRSSGLKVVRNRVTRPRTAPIHLIAPCCRLTPDPTATRGHCLAVDRWHLRSTRGTRRVRADATRDTAKTPSISSRRPDSSDPPTQKALAVARAFSVGTIRTRLRRAP